MPFLAREVASWTEVLVDEDEALAETDVLGADPDKALQNAHVQRLVGFMMQVGVLADFAADIFEDLADEADKVTRKITHVCEKVEALEHPHTTPSSDLTIGPLASVPTQGLLSPATRPSALKALYSAARPAPSASIITASATMPE